MDMQMQLVADGYAAHYRPRAASRLPQWARFRDVAYGTTMEPVVVVYNKRLLHDSAIPRDRKQLAALLRAPDSPFTDKVTSFDITKSGTGYLFAAQDAEADHENEKLLKTFGEAGIRTSGGTGDMLTAIDRGEALLGYNMMGSYALSRAGKDLPNLGIVYPSDYTLVLSRVAFISKRASHPAAARLWLDYLLSTRGQQLLGNALELYPIRDDVEARLTAKKLREAIGSGMRAIPLETKLTRPLQEAWRANFVMRWKGATGS